MKAFLSILFIFLSISAHAQMIGSSSKTAAGLCLTCTNSIGFIPMESHQLQDLDNALAGKKSSSESTHALRHQETLAERNARIYRLPIKESSSTEEKDKSKKIEIIYALDPSANSVLNFGLNRNDESNDPSLVSKPKKNRKILGVKYRKKF